MTQTMTPPKRSPAAPVPSTDGSINPRLARRSTVSALRRSSADELRKINEFWRACNYLALGMTYLKGNPLLKEPLKPEHIKDRLLGHWGTSPGLAFCYAPPEPGD